MKNLINSLFGNHKNKSKWNNPEFIEGAFEGLQLQTEVHKNTWKLGQESQWNVDLNKGMLWFEFSDGKSVVTEIQIIGTYNSNNGTFLWGWDHPSVREELAQHATLAFEWGKKNNEPSFTEVQLNCSIDDVWKIAAAVNRIANANGVYKGNSGATQVFMTLGEIKMEN